MAVPKGYHELIWRLIVNFIRKKWNDFKFADYTKGMGWSQNWLFCGQFIMSDYQSPASVGLFTFDRTRTNKPGSRFLALTMSRSAAIPTPVFPPPSDLASSTNLTLPSSGRDHSTANEQSEEGAEEEEEETATESQPGGYLKPARSK